MLLLLLLLSCDFLDLFAIFWRSQPNRADRLDASILASYCWYRITFTYISGRCISAPEPARFPLSFLAFVSCCLNDQDSHKCFSRMYTCVRSPADAISQMDWNKKNNNSAAPLLQWSQTTANPSGPAIFEVAVDG